MTQATEIMHSSRNANEASDAAELIAIDINHDWENERTIFTFDDDSVLVICGSQLNCFESIDEIDD